MTDKSIQIGKSDGLSFISDKFRFTATGLKVNRAPSYEEWVDFGKGLKAVHASVKWWIGDWLNYGERAYGEKYSQALDITDYEYQTLANASYVSGKIKVSRRRENLSFSHHAEVASLKATEQTLWLSRAEKEGWSVREFRTNIAKSRDDYEDSQRLKAKIEDLDVQSAMVKKVLNLSVQIADMTEELEETRLGKGNKTIVMDSLHGMRSLINGLIERGLAKETPPSKRLPKSKKLTQTIQGVVLPKAYLRCPLCAHQFDNTDVGLEKEPSDDYVIKCSKCKQEFEYGETEKALDSKMYKTRRW